MLSIEPDKEWAGGGGGINDYKNKQYQLRAYHVIYMNYLIILLTTAVQRRNYYSCHLVGEETETHQE